jgi:hypothetical protein
LSFRESRAPGGEQANALDTDRWYWKKAEIFWVMGSRMLKRVRGSLNTPPHGWIKACESRVRAGGGGVAAAPLADSVYQRENGRDCGRIGRAAWVRGCVGAGWAAVRRKFGRGGWPTRALRRGPCNSACDTGLREPKRSALPYLGNDRGVEAAGRQDAWIQGLKAECVFDRCRDVQRSAALVDCPE